MSRSITSEEWKRWLDGDAAVMPSWQARDLLPVLVEARQMIRALKDQLRAAEAMEWHPVQLADLDARVIPGVGQTIGESASRSAHGAIAMGSGSRSGAVPPDGGRDAASRGGLSTRQSRNGEG